MAGAAADDAAASGRLSWLELAAGLWVAFLATASWAALVTAHLGRFSALAAALAGGAAVAFFAWACSRTALLPPRPRGAELALTLLAFAVALAGLMRLYPAASPWPTMLDGGWYLNAGRRIALEGRLTFEPDALTSLLSRAKAAPHEADVVVSTLADGRAAGMPFPDDASRGFHDVAFAVPQVGRGSVAPFHPPLFATWLAAWMRLPIPGAVAAAGNAVLPWAAAFLLAAGAWAAAAFGLPAGVLAMSLIVVGPAFAYYGATPYAEMMAGSLAVAGLWLLTRLERLGSSPGTGALAGLALGLAVLAKPEILLVVGIAGLWWLLARRRAGGAREGAALLAGGALPIAHHAILATTVSEFYWRLNGGGVLAIARGHALALAAGAAGLLLVALVVFAEPAPGTRLARHARAARRALSLAVVATVLAALVLEYLAPDAAPPGMLGILQWMLTPLGLWAAVSGVVLGLEGDRRRTSLLLGTALLLTPVLVLAPAVTRTLSPLYAGRRLVPVVLPALSALGACTAVYVAGLRPRRWMRLLAASGTALVLLGLLVAARPLAGWREFTGSAVIAGRVARHASPRDVILFPSTLGVSDAGRMAAAIWNLEDRPTAVLASPTVDPAAVDRAIDAWTAEGRRVFMVAGSTDELPDLASHELAFVADESLVTRALSPAPQLPVASTTRELRLTVYEAVPSERP